MTRESTDSSWEAVGSSSSEATLQDGHFRQRPDPVPRDYLTPPRPTPASSTPAGSPPAGSTLLPGFNFDSLLARRRQMEEIGIEDPNDLEAQQQQPPSTTTTRTPRGGSGLARTALFTATMCSVFASHEQVMLPIDRSAPYQYQNFHMVRGRPMHGMIVDTGTAKAIMGTDTMKEYISDTLSRYGKVIKVSPSET
eukprot:4547826-Pyramimonas_sp.AAC.1